jgi:hypothetical protein
MPLGGDLFSHAWKLAMRRILLLFATLALSTSLASTGCRSCSSCHDYSPPVADCGCSSCGTGRAGSASGGYIASGEYSEEQAVEIQQ